MPKLIQPLEDLIEAGITLDFGGLEGLNVKTILVAERVTIIGPKEDGGFIGLTYEPSKAKNKNLEKFRNYTDGLIEIVVSNKGYKIFSTNKFLDRYHRYHFTEVSKRDYRTRLKKLGIQ